MQFYLEYYSLARVIANGNFFVFLSWRLTTQKAGKFKRNLASYCFAAVAIMILFGLVALPCSAFFCFASLFCSTSHELRLTVKIKVSNLEHHQNWKVYQNSIFAMIDWFILYQTTIFFWQIASKLLIFKMWSCFFQP